MRTNLPLLTGLILLIASACMSSACMYGEDLAEQPIQRMDGTTITSAALDTIVQHWMKKERVTGLALAVVHQGKVVYIKAYGERSAELHLPLEINTVMYGASLTKMAFAYMVMQLCEEGLLKLDRPISEYLKKPLPDYEKYRDLAGDLRWKKLTSRMLLNHTTGFPNFRFANPGGKLDFKLEPGTQYGYSGEGINLMQFVLEEGLGLHVGKEMQRRVFDRFGMKQTSMTWRDDFSANMTNGYDVNGKVQGHSMRRNVRAAGSMDTTIHDFSLFLAGYLRNEGLTAKSWEELTSPRMAITTSHQFPTIEINPRSPFKHIGLSTGLGVVLFTGPQGLTFFKGGHDDYTSNFTLGVLSKKCGIVLLSNSVRGELTYPALVQSIMGETGMPWAWEYTPTDGAVPKK